MYVLVYLTFVGKYTFRISQIAKGYTMIVGSQLSTRQATKEITFTLPLFVVENCICIFNCISILYPSCTNDSTNYVRIIIGATIR